VAFSACLKALDALYLTEAIQRGKVIPFQEEIPMLLEVTKWATIFDFTNWTSVYMVKFAFQYFFHPLISGMPRKIRTFYWATVGVITVSWLYTIMVSIIICPHFGAEAG
jgi:hypothetical protein